MTSGRIDYFSLTRSINASYPGPFGRSWPDQPVDSTSALTSEALIALAELHEHDHFAALLATPLGLLLWRTDAVHFVDGIWFGRRMEEARVTECRGGLHEWFAQPANRQLILNAAVEGRLSPDKPPPDAATAIGTMDDYLVGLGAAQRTRELLIGWTVASRATVGDFLRSANVGHRYLAVRSDLPSHHWLSRLDPTTPLYGQVGINALHILEAMARLRELDVLRDRQVPQSSIDAWEDQMIAGRYEPVVSALRNAGLDSIPARNVCAAALGGLLDPAVVPPGRSTLYAEEELPWFRFARLLDAYRESGIESDALRSRATVEQLCGAAKIAPPRIAVERGASASLLGPNANWNPVARAGLGIKLLELFEQTWLDPLDWFRRSFVRQVGAWRGDTLVDPDLPSGPVLYDDVATLFPQSHDDDALAIEVLRWRRRLLSEHTLRFFDGKPVDPPASLARRVEAGMSVLGVSPEHIRHFVDAILLDRVPLINERPLGNFVEPAILARSLSYFRKPSLR